MELETEKRPLQMEELQVNVHEVQKIMDTEVRKAMRPDSITR